MKIHKPIPQDLIRVSITKQGEPTMYFSLEECTQEEVISTFKEWLKPLVSAFPEGKRISVNVREAKGGKNGLSRSFNFYGLSTLEVYNTLITKLNE